MGGAAGGETGSGAVDFGQGKSDVDEEAVLDVGEDIVIVDSSEDIAGDGLSLGDEEETGGAMEGTGEGHAGAEVLEGDFADPAGEVLFLGDGEEGADGFGIEAGIGMFLNDADGIFAGVTTFDEGAGDGEEACGHGDGFFAEAIGVAGAIPLFVMGADGFADAGEVADEGGEGFAVDGVAADEGALLVVEEFGIMEGEGEDVARDAEESDIVEGSGDAEDLFFVGREEIELGKLAADLLNGTGGFTEERGEGGHNAVAQLDGVVKVGGKGFVGLGELDVELGSQLFEALVAEEDAVMSGGVVEGGEEFLLGPWFGEEAVELAGIDGLDSHFGGRVAGHEDAGCHGLAFPALPEKAEAILFGQILIAKDGGEAMLAEEFPCLAGVGGGMDGKFVWVEDIGEQVSDALVVIDDQNGKRRMGFLDGERGIGRVRLHGRKGLAIRQKIPDG